jgi:hypothetical protein
MKFSGQIKDGVIDNLLRAYVSRPGNPHQLCVEFDPDKANAYIEHLLSGSERSQYEQHLSECAHCRKSIVGLARLAHQTDPVSATPRIIEPPRTSWLEGARQMLGVLARPQWAIAATAALVMAISLPFILSNKSGAGSFQADKSNAPAIASAANEEPEAQGRASETHSDKNQVPQAADSFVALQQPPSALKAERQTKNGPAESKVVNEAQQREADSTKQLAKDSSDSKNDSKSATASDAVSQNARVAAATPEAGARDAENRQQPPEKEKAAEEAPKKPVPTDEQADKTKRERAEQIAPPPPASSAPAASADSRKDQTAIGKTRAKLAFGSSTSSESARVSPERKVSGKKFLFKDGAWTDKDYDPDKDLPLVTIVRDSNVYKEVLGKRPGLKPYLAGFAPTDRAIIVYKGTVYKLIPQ